MGSGIGIGGIIHVLRRVFGRLPKPWGDQRASGRFGHMPSSVIRTFSYDERTHTLAVLFVSGLRYRYAGVPEAIAQGLATAPSKGAYFNDHIRDNFKFERRRDRG
jgi:hypothetical protein